MCAQQVLTDKYESAYLWCKLNNAFTAKAHLVLCSQDLDTLSVSCLCGIPLHARDAFDYYPVSSYFTDRSGYCVSCLELALQSRLRLPALHQVPITLHMLHRHESLAYQQKASKLSSTTEPWRTRSMRRYYYVFCIMSLGLMLTLLALTGK